MFRPLNRPWRALGAAVILAIVALIAINLFDQELSPEARALFERATPEFSRDSGWALMAGLNAPVGEEPRAFAESHRGKAKPGAPSVALLEIRAPAELLCLPQEADCVRAFALKPESASDLAADNAVLLARYDELLRTTRLTDAASALDFYGSNGFFYVVMNTHRVRLSQIAAAAAAGRTEAAIAWLETDAAFYRRWLDQSGSILSKMLAIRGFTHDQLVAGQVIRAAPGLTPAQWEAIERITAPLTISQRGFAGAVRTEAAFFAKINDEMIASPRSTGEIIGAPRLAADIVGRVLKRNATLNFAYGLFEPWTRMDTVDSSALAPAIAAAKAEVARHAEPDWTWIYNFVGKSVAAEQAPDLAQYVYRLRDADALTAVMRCTAALRRSMVAADAAAALVSSSPACVDPYTARPLQWDGRELSYKAGWEQEVTRLGGRAGRVTFAVYP